MALTLPSHPMGEGESFSAGWSVEHRSSQDALERKKDLSAASSSPTRLSQEIIAASRSLKVAARKLTP
jgi:hypothetical protein